MLAPAYTRQFERDGKRMKKRGKDLDKLKIIIRSLVAEEPLDAIHRDHGLVGNWKGPWLCMPMIMGIVSIYFFIAGARRYDLLQFLGIRQLMEQRNCRVLTDDCSLDTQGVLSIVRHPWYTGGILIVWARPLDLSAILTNLVVSGYFVVGAILEERKLKVQFGEQYVAYQKRVPMFFPIRRKGADRSGG